MTASARFAQALVRPARDWWAIVHFAAMTLVMALSPSTYRGVQRSAIARNIHVTTWQVLPWFTVLCALLSLVLIRIVVVTAKSYGLSSFALEVVVRVLVLELIPLGAALFVVLRTGVAPLVATTVAAAPQRGERGRQVSMAISNAIAGGFSVLMLTAVSSVLALVLAYLVVYGLSPWGFDGYTRMVGRVFSPAITFGFLLKSVLFALAVAVVPTASALQPQRPAKVAQAMPVSVGTVRLFMALLLIEGASLIVKYI